MLPYVTMWFVPESLKSEILLNYIEIDSFSDKNEIKNRTIDTRSENMMLHMCKKVHTCALRSCPEMLALVKNIEKMTKATIRK